MSDRKDLDFYKPGQFLADDEQGRHLRDMDFHQQRKLRQNTYWEGQGRHQTTMMRLATEYEEARQQREARVEYGPKLLALEYEKRRLDLALDVEEKRQMLRALQGRGPKKTQPNNDLVLQALLARREQLEADGIDTSAIDREIEARR